MRTCVASLFGSLVFISAKQDYGSARNESVLNDVPVITSLDEEEALRKKGATVLDCQGFDPPVRNKAYISYFHVDVLSERFTDPYRNISVYLNLTQYLRKNPLLHFYVTDMETFSYQCWNRRSCTFKLCDPETPQELRLTNMWGGRCPLAPGRYHYEFSYSIRQALDRQKTRTGFLTVQAQLHESYKCLACFIIRMKLKKE